MIDLERERARLERLTARLASALEHRAALERLTLAAMEHEQQQRQSTLDLMRSSAGLRLFTSLRKQSTRAASIARHPVWTAGGAARRLAATPPVAAGTRALAHLAVRGFPLRVAAAAAEESDRRDPLGSVRWVGAVAVRHVRRDALLCVPDASVEYRVTAPARARFVTFVAILPDAWRTAPGPVTFSIAVEAPSHSWQERRELTIDPGSRHTDRRWHRLAIALPSNTSASTDVVIRLTTRAAAAHAVPALFGDPRLVWRRPAPEVRRSIASFARQLRAGGLPGARGLIQRAGSAEHDTKAYARWIAARDRTPEDLRALQADVAALPHQPLISIITPVYNTDPKWLRACVESVRAQVYPRWELCLCDDASTSRATVAALAAFESDPRIRFTRLTTNSGISTASNAALATARGEFVALLDHDDELTPDALAEIVRFINARPDADVIYSDEDKLDLAGQRCEPCFKPDWSPEHFLHRMYTCHFTVVRRSLVTEVGGFRTGYEGAQDYDLMLRLAERTDRIAHLPRVLYHWRKLPQSTASAGQAKPWAQDAGKRALDDCVRRRGLDAEVVPGGAPGLFRIRRRIAGAPLVSIVIPTAGRCRDVRGTPTDLLARAVRSIVERTGWPEYEFVIVADEAGLQPSSLRALEGARHRVIAMEAHAPFNFSRKINAGVAASNGSHVLLFNDDVEAIERDWMTAMLEYSQDQGIGAVGAKLQYPDGRLQHAGIVLGVLGIAAHAYHQHPGATEGYFGSVIGPRNVSAVTGACLMSRREVFDRVGGFDEAFPVDFNDVDYCLRVRRAGYRIVYTPYARLVHHESASVGPRTPDAAAVAAMRARWQDTIEDDPYYNPNLTRDAADYRLGPA